MVVIYMYWENLRALSRDYESSVINTDAYLIEILNNMDKVIVRGQYRNENDRI